MCDNRTVAPQVIESQLDLGRRVAQGRDAAGLTQAELAEAIGIDRTAVAKIESGARRVSATELVALASVLDRPVDWFVIESPSAVVSRRQDPAVGGRSRSLDAYVERISRDAEFLLGEGVLSARERHSLPMPMDYAQAEALAESARSLMGVPRGPLMDLQAAVENVGLLGFSLDLGAENGDGAYISLDGWGVAVVNGSVDPGRRRFDLAHELGHHLVGDAYAPELDVMTDGQTERMLNAFVPYVLMPREDITEVWADFSQADRRLGAIAIATRFRASWTAVCSHLCNLGLIDTEERGSLSGAPPRKGDMLELGERWVTELEPPSVPPDYGRRVVGAYRTGKLTAAKSIDLLWGTIQERDLPEPVAIPLEGLQREFEPLH